MFDNFVTGFILKSRTQLLFTFWKSKKQTNKQTKKALEKGLKYIQSYQ